MFADGAVESANVVGYSTTTTIGDGGFTQIVPSFVNVADNSKIKLSDLTFAPARNDNIQLFDEIGDIMEVLTYSRRGTSGNYTFYWKNEAGDEVADYDFPRGSSMWLNTSNPVAFTQSGTVVSGKTVVIIPGDGGFAQTGNSTPIAITLSQLEFDGISRNDNIQMFDENGNIKEVLTYSRRGTSGNYTFYWKNEAGDEVDPATYTFQPGEEFWVNFSNPGTMTLPSAL